MFPLFFIYLSNYIIISVSRSKSMNTPGQKTTPSGSFLRAFAHYIFPTSCFIGVCFLLSFSFFGCCGVLSIIFYNLYSRPFHHAVHKGVELLSHGSLRRRAQFLWGQGRYFCGHSGKPCYICTKDTDILPSLDHPGSNITFSNIKYNI